MQTSASRANSSLPPPRALLARARAVDRSPVRPSSGPRSRRDAVFGANPCADIVSWLFFHAFRGARPRPLREERDGSRFDGAGRFRQQSGLAATASREVWIVWRHGATWGRDDPRGEVRSFAAFGSRRGRRDGRLHVARSGGNLSGRMTCVLPFFSVLLCRFHASASCVGCLPFCVANHVHFV